MIVAARGDGIFLSDRIGVINLEKKTHNLQSVESASKWGYWETDVSSDSQLPRASEYEEAVLRGA